MMPYDVVSVTPVSPLSPSVRFADGLCGEVVFRDSHLYGVFSALKDPELFAQVRCNQGFVEWPGGN